MNHVIKAPTANPLYYMWIRCDQPTDLIVMREIFSENIYEVYDGDLADTGIVVDLGANIAAFSIYAVSLSPKAIVYAVEPEPNNMEILRRNIELGGLEERIIPIQKAVGKKKGRGRISDSGGDSRVGSAGSACEITTLAQIWADHRLEYIDILKIDVEGAEADILLGTEGALLNLCRYITLEFDPGAALGKMVEKLSATHQLKVVGTQEGGGYLFCKRY